MNCKRHNSMLAISTTGLVLVAGLLLATPLSSPRLADGNSSALAGIVLGAPSPGTANVQRTAELEVRTQRFESEMRHMTDTGQAIARTASFVAEVATDTAIAAALNHIQSSAATETAPEPAADASQRTRRSARSAFATPYFSFAHGLRDGNGA